MKRLLVLGASVFQAPLIKKAGEMGLETIVFDMDKTAPGVKYATEFHHYSTLDTENAIRVAREKNISGVTTTSDFPVCNVAHIAAELGLKALSVRNAEVCTNKFLQREYLKKANLPYPKYKLTQSRAELAEIETWDFPVIVKPVDSSGSRGVQKAQTVDCLRPAYELALENSRNGHVIIEEFIEGKEFSAEVLIQNGQAHIVAITEKVTSGFDGLFFVEEMHVVPAPISAEQESQVKSLLKQYIKVLELDNCAAHAEFKINSKGVYVIEIAARLGGDFITSDLVPAATGIDMIKATIQISLGETIDTTAKKKSFAGIRFLTPDNYEKGVAHIKTIKDLPEILRIEQVDKCNNKILKSSFDRLGYVIAVANTRAQLDAILDF